MATDEKKETLSEVIRVFPSDLKRLTAFREGFFVCFGFHGILYDWKVYIPDHIITISLRYIEIILQSTALVTLTEN